MDFVVNTNQNVYQNIVIKVYADMQLRQNLITFKLFV